MRVLDACALLAFFRREKGGEAVYELLRGSGGTVAIHSLNLVEVYYDIYRDGGETAANRGVEVTLAVGVELHEELDPALWKLAGALKAEWKRISLADCFAIALTQRLGATLLTSDHAEFDKIVRAGVCPIQFIR